MNFGFIALLIGLLLGIVAPIIRDNINYKQIKSHIPWFYHKIYMRIIQDAPMLFDKYRLGRRIGDYGELVDDAWRQEVVYYVQNVLLPQMTRDTDLIDERFLLFWILPEEQFDETEFPSNQWIVKQFKFSDFIQNIKKTEKEPTFIYIFKRSSGITPPAVSITKNAEHFCIQVRVLCKYLFGSDVYTPINKIKTPIDYEYFIASELKSLGFNARTTKASGDQGADVLAAKNGVSFAIQCKKYSKPVGNKAVQEANAGRDFYKKDFGVVVSNAGFTKSAKQAANACGVILLNDAQLDKLLKYTNEPSDA